MSTEVTPEDGTYCIESDLLIGDIPTPAYVNKSQYIVAAAEEIDAALATRYITPIILDQNDPKTRQGRLILKKLNVHIASGRLIMAAAAGGEDTEVHAYARYLLREAAAALTGLREGRPIIEGAEEAEVSGDLSGKPVFLNADERSLVDEFYTVTSPYSLLDGTRYAY